MKLLFPEVARHCGRPDLRAGEEYATHDMDAPDDYVYLVPLLIKYLLHVLSRACSYLIIIRFPVEGSVWSSSISGFPPFLSNEMRTKKAA